MATNAGRVGGIGYSYSLGMLVGGMMLFGMNLFVLLKVLRALERFLANLAGVRLERSVYWGAVSRTSERRKKRRRYL